MKIALACSPFAACALGALSYPVCEWIGRWQVKRYLAGLEAAGYAVDLEKYYVPASSPERDIFQHPAMIRELEEQEVRGLWQQEPPIPGLARFRPRFQPELGVAFDVRTWFAPLAAEEAPAARHLLGELREATARMGEVRLALQRPETAWSVRWVASEDMKGMKIPDVALSVIRLQNLARFETEMISLHLAAEDSSSASACVESLADICGHLLGSRPSMISVIVAAGCSRQIEMGIWDGVVREAWTEEQLARFEARLAAFEPQTSASRSFLGEIAFMRWKSQALLDTAEEDRPMKAHWTEGWEWDPDRILKRSRGLWRSVRPKGIDLMKRVANQRTFDDQFSRHDGSARTRFTPEDLSFFRQQHDNSPLALFVNEKGQASEEVDLDAVAWTDLRNFAGIALRMETGFALLRTGIALERYRLKTGSMPDRLDALVPSYLPAVFSDPFDGAPLRYRRQADGSPHVWSVGGDLVDEGGLPHSDRQDKGDLIWITRPIPGFTAKDLRR
jgi:hypothetical protein